MIKEIVATGKNVDEAKENARAALGAGPLDDVNFEIIHLGSKGIFGIIGVKPAQVRAYIELPDQAEPRRKRFEKPKKPQQERERRENKPKRSPEAEKPRRREEEKPAAPVERERVIPEAELKLERRDVKRGEDMSFDFVSTLIADIGLEAEATLYACEDGTRRIVVDGKDASTLIGHHGDTLDAIQYLANLASARKNANGERDKSRVTIDIEGYRAKREETLRALARRMAQKALKNKRSVMLEPMNPYERRIIHSEVQSIEGVSTNSVGTDNNRKIVIYLTDKKPKGLFENEGTPIADDFADDANGEYAPVDETVTEMSSEDGEIAVAPTIPDTNEDPVEDGEK